MLIIFAEAHMYDYLVKGGVLMIPILLCSIVGLAVFFERLWVLRTSKNVPVALSARAKELVRRGQVDEALSLSSKSRTPLGRILSAALRNAGYEREAVKESVEEVGRTEAAHLERYVGILGTVANVSPLLGLLGTVSGMIKVFEMISVQGVGDPSVLAEGIHEALITTAAGLSVAIPALIAHRYFVGKVDRIVLELEQQALHFVDLVKHPESKPQATAVNGRAGG